MRRRVLVTDGEQRAALAVVRSLGRAGYQVTVASPRTPSLAGASRWAASERRVPDPLREPAAFVDAVATIAYAESAALLLPMTDASLLALLGARERFPEIALPFPGLEVFRRTADKQLVLATARSAGLAVPDQRVVTTKGEASNLDAAALSYPLVLKPARSVSGVDAARQKFGVRHVGDAEALRVALRELPSQAFPVLLQQRIVGPGVGIFLLVWNGRTRAVFAHRRLREKPPSGGVSVYRESIPADPRLVERSRALLDALGFEGVAMVEYKVEAASGTPYLMEINGRFWGSLQLAVDAGVDFPRLLAEAALGGDPGPIPVYRSGVRSRWWWGDVDQLIARMTRSRERLALPPGEPGRFRTMRDFLALWRRGDRNEILRLDDPQPFVRETLDWLLRR
jgi:predicted ATP-grasp superfamily ATP-dependent carboligase